MKSLALVLTTLIVLLQYPLWFGKGSWHKVWLVDQEVTIAREENRRLQNRNIMLAAEVNDLKQGFDAIEEHARSDLGMIKQDEVLFQVIERNTSNTLPPNLDTDTLH
ncbi:MAG: cell division protein FtsB [Betaproteobacteria bacterium]|nr:cell division protein FtsB [Betaproteobacteria bacterium]